MSLLDSFIELWKFDSPVTFGNQMIIVIAAILLGAGIMLLVCTYSVHATILEKESPPISTNGSDLTLSDDTLDTDITVNIDDLEEDALTENQTQMISTKGADDLDIDGFPPKDVTVVITNNTVIVTKVPVIFEMNKELEPSIIDEIADTAYDQSNGTVIINAPALENQTFDFLESEEDG